jgi:Ca-activated chloride channel family protein
MKFISGLLLILISVVSLDASAFDLKGIQNNNQGVKAFKEERLNDAYNAFVTSLSELPFSPEIHYNLGRTFFENKEYDKAQKEAKIAAKYAPEKSETKFQALFLQGASLGEAKKVDEAIAAYQEALEIKPDSVEVKTNIELLTQQQQGGGGGEDQQQQQQQGDGKDQKQDPNQGQQQQQQQKQPKPFKSDELNKKDVENILDELERQEEEIRAKFQREGVKEAPKDKDW